MSTDIDKSTNVYSNAIQNLMLKSKDNLTKNPNLFKIA